MIHSYVESLDGDPMFIGTTCAPGSTFIGRRGKASHLPPTCLSCVLGRENRGYTTSLLETIDNVAFITEPTGGLTVVKDRIALDKLTERLKNPPEQINNSSLYAGSPMHFYCKICGWKSDVLPESYVTPPKRYCTECSELKKANPEITDATLTELASRPRK